ncbi:hypothetical protein CLOM621_05455 [Clostridium sp. M62/1]|nr:hypothetical protein CLOM621_05455 [Clostridium sp. M62/1]
MQGIQAPGHMDEKTDGGRNMRLSGRMGAGNRGMHRQRKDSSEIPGQDRFPTQRRTVRLSCLKFRDC